jgi:hypothetical protein
MYAFLDQLMRDPTSPVSSDHLVILALNMFCTGGGVPSAAAGELAQIRTPAVRVCYEDEYRHLPCALARVGKGQKRGREDLG